MPKYILTNTIYFESGIIEAGKVIELPEDQAKAYVERGSMKPYSEKEDGKVEEAPVAVEVPQDTPTVPGATPTAEQIAQDLKDAGV